MTTSSVLELEAGKITVLYIDDDLRPQERLISELRNLGVALQDKFDPESADQELDPSKDQNVIVILDLMFPERPEVGINYLTRIRCGDTKIPMHAPVVVQTNASEYYKNAALEFGCDEFIKKADSGELIHAIQRYIRLVEQRPGIKSTRALCQVEEVDDRRELVRILVDGQEGYSLEQYVDLDLCPKGARQVGGAFYLVTTRWTEPSGAVQEVRGRAAPFMEEQEWLTQLGFSDD